MTGKKNEIKSAISYGETDRTWEKYDLFMNPILSNGKKTVYRAVMRQNDLVAIVKKHYTLFPNEEALKISDQAAKLAKMAPFVVKKNDNWMMNKSDTRLYAMYVPKSAVADGIAGHQMVQVNGDEVLTGITIRNSIDGSSSFGVGLFTFRSACSNGVIVGRKDIASIYKVHTKSLNATTNRLRDIILSMMERGNDVIESYREMAETKITLELVEKLNKSRLSKNVLPNYVTEKDLKSELKKLTEWQLYNDITAAIWHGAKTDISTKDLQFGYLHTVMPVVSL